MRNPAWSRVIRRLERQHGNSTGGHFLNSGISLVCCKGNFTGAPALACLCFSWVCLQLTWTLEVKCYLWCRCTMASSASWVPFNRQSALLLWNAGLNSEHLSIVSHSCQNNKWTCRPGAWSSYHNWSCTLISGFVFSALLDWLCFLNLSACPIFFFFPHFHGLRMLEAESFRAKISWMACWAFRMGVSLVPFQVLFWESDRYYYDTI